MNRVMLWGMMALGFAGAAFAEDPKTTDALYSDFKRELLKAVRNYSSNPDMRSTATTAARSMFEKLINDAKPARVRTQEQIYIDFLTKLSDIIKMDSVSYAAERQMWVGAAYKVFETDTKYAKDKDEVRTTQECFDVFARRLEKIAGSLATTQDLRNEAEKAAKKLYDDTLNLAVDSPGFDALVQFNKNTARADKTFPLNTDDEKLFNQSPNALIKDAAKRAMDRSIQSRNK